MVVAASAADGILFQQPPAGHGLACVINPGPGAPDGVYELPGRGAYSAKSLQEIQHDSFCAEHGPQGAGNRCELVGDIGPLSIANEDAELELVIIAVAVISSATVIRLVGSPEPKSSLTAIFIKGCIFARSSFFISPYCLSISQFSWARRYQFY